MKRLAMLCALLAGCRGPGKEGPVRLVVLDSMAHMPVALADSLGYYKEEGATVTIEMLSTTSKAVETLLAGGADAVTGVYEQTLQLAVEGQSLRSFVAFSDDARLVVALAGRLGIRSLRDLKGRVLGVPGPGSANHLFANYMLVRSGIPLADVRLAGIGVGRSAIAAVERGVVDAASVVFRDFVYLRKIHPDIVVLADSTTAANRREAYGSESYPTGSLLARSEWLNQHPDQARKVARATQRALQWLQQHSAEEIRERMPGVYRTNNDEVDIETIRAMKSNWSRDGVMPADGPETVRRAMALTNEKIRDGKIDLSKTYTNEFVKEAR